MPTTAKNQEWSHSANPCTLTGHMGIPAAGPVPIPWLGFYADPCCFLGHIPSKAGWLQCSKTCMLGESPRVLCLVYFFFFFFSSFTKIMWQERLWLRLSKQWHPLTVPPCCSPDIGILMGADRDWKENRDTEDLQGTGSGKKWQWDFGRV